ncbi:AraC family transcriptional regulator [Actinoplanes sp. NPDC048967]|uniref:AraC family transcriptional regulator n=1 Tax=Actinoplanes sp. NPDC048967 TaxID=3155269 RepID=UPI0033F68E2B
MLDELARAVTGHCPGFWVESAVPRLSLVAADEAPAVVDMMYTPMLCFVASGAKRATAGDHSALVEAGHMFVSSLELPVTATFERLPYRSVVLTLDEQVLADLLLELGEAARLPEPDPGGVVSTPMGPELVDAVTRWVRLLDAPRDIGPLAGRIESEILYRLLGGPLGPVLRQFALADSHVTQVRRVSGWIRENHASPLRIEAVAAMATMSTATLHRHFRRATGMSPLQYQKVVRLQEARRLLVAGDTTAAIVGERVGYTSATQFNREYRRAYGIPPAQDAVRLRAQLLRTSARRQAPAVTAAQNASA